ncbi:LANO_0E10000g1_1 [Lachancea nothofagi CBS 11611]|uniref:Elongin-C n=1 Tax=Lachancea nothofagi CBS 11611 TaxID=1266666 RepID=A0A1G4JW85_9SACH|nr:LANO_0E10000g1_1 [Lachancea nothofagi CBS 11611]
MSEVLLVSKDDLEIPVSYEAAIISPVLKGMLSGPFLEEHPIKIELKDIEPQVLAKVVEYLEYCSTYRNVGENDDIPEFDVPTEMSLELLLVADYLNI